MKVVSKVLLFVSCLILLMSLSLLPLDDAVAREKGGGPERTNNSQAGRNDAVAGEKGGGPGRSPGPSERPPGWDEGEKKGWDSNVPPGLEGKGKEEGRGQKVEGEGEKKGKLEGGSSTSGPDEKEGKLEKGKKGKEGKEGKKDKKDGGKAEKGSGDPLKGLHLPKPPVKK